MRTDTESADHVRTIETHRIQIEDAEGNCVCLTVEGSRWVTDNLLSRINNFSDGSAKIVHQVMS